MPKFKKGILKAGRTYHSPTGELAVDENRLRHWESTFKGFSEAGIRVPVAWDHSKDPEKSKPYELSPSQRKRRRVAPPQDNVGFLDSFKVADDGQSAEITLDIPRAVDASKVEANLADVSPVIFDNWKDGSGTVHEDVITHVDLVVHPVDSSQSRFEKVDSEGHEMIACSLTFFEEDDNAPNVFQLGLEDAEESDLDDLALDSEDESDEDSGTSEMDDPERLKSVLESLTALGLVLSSDTTIDNFLSHLHQALLTANAMGGDDVANENLEVQSPQMTAMSLELQAMKKHSSAAHRDVLAQRLQTLLETGRCTPAEHKDKSAGVTTIQLSLNSEGVNEPTAIEHWIASREPVPAGTFWDAERRTSMSLNVEKQPGVVTGEQMSEEEADKLADQILRKS